MIVEPPRRGQPITVDGYATRRFSEYLESLAMETESNTSSTSAQSIQVSTTQSLVARLAELERSRAKITLISDSATAKPFETVVCTNSSTITVTLEQNPIAGDEINIKRTNGPVIVAGQIDGVTNKLINIRYYSMKLVYNGSEWSEL